jgi:DNA-binding CsgD family transcriptional regulator
MNDVYKLANSVAVSGEVGWAPLSANFEYWQVWDVLTEPQRPGAAPQYGGAAGLSRDLTNRLRGELRHGLHRATAMLDRCDRRGDRAGCARIHANFGLARGYLGDLAEAQEHLELAAAIARTCGARWEQGYAAFADGTLCRRTGRPIVAQARFKAAAEIFASRSDLLEFGWAKHGTAVTRGEHSETAQARSHAASAALDAFRRTGSHSGMLAALHVLTELAHEAHPLSEERRPRTTILPGHDAVPGPAPRAGNRIPPRNVGPALGRSSALQKLTRRELEVAELVAAGLTNRQIGARMIIAERTVDTHVQRILAKLGCATRVQVAVMVSAAPPMSRTRDISSVP